MSFWTNPAPGFMRGRGSAGIQDYFKIVLAPGIDLQSAVNSALPSADLIISKSRSTGDWLWRSSTAGLSNQVSSNSDRAQGQFTGYTGAEGYAGWLYKIAPKFYDQISYTGNGVSGRQIPHSLGVSPGMIVIKRLDVSSGWFVYHRSIGASAWLRLETDNASAGAPSLWYGDPSDSVFYLTDSAAINAVGGQYVAHVYAHDDSPDGVIQCGSYIGNGLSTGPSVNLGWSPQYILIKSASNSGTFWCVFDTARGISVGDDALLRMNYTVGEGPFQGVNLTEDGFAASSSSIIVNGASSTYIYMAIRAEGV